MIESHFTITYDTYITTPRDTFHQGNMYPPGREEAALLEEQVMAFCLACGGTGPVAVARD